MQVSKYPLSCWTDSPSIALDLDYIGYTYHHTDMSPYTPHVINHHSHIFAGLREKYAPLNSHRDSIWQKLQMLPIEKLTEYLDQIYSQYLPTLSMTTASHQEEEDEENTDMVQEGKE
jgi:hypothetical protein